MFYQIDKRKGQKLSPNFAQHEADCKCEYRDCTFTTIHSSVLEALEKLRQLCDNKPLYITSFFRCQRHNTDVGGVPNSYHKRGLAVDVAVPSHLTEEDFYSKCSEAGFTFCLLYPEEDFVHCQINLQKKKIADYDV